MAGYGHNKHRLTYDRYYVENLLQSDLDELYEKRDLNDIQVNGFHVNFFPINEQIEVAKKTFDVISFRINKDTQIIYQSLLPISESRIVKFPVARDKFAEYLETRQRHGRNPQ